jgi:hypothetical protein
MSLNKRYKSAIWADTSLNITVIGLGGVGKGVAVNLALNGHKLGLYDGDTVEEHNCIPQGYYPTQIGMPKVKAIEQELSFYKEITNEINYRYEYWDDSYSLANNVIVCPDRMDVRVSAFNEWLNYYIIDKEHSFFMDIRMLAEYFEIYFLSSKDGLVENIDEYKQRALSDTENQPVNCTFTQTRYVANMCHGKVVELINKYIVNLKTGTDVYTIPLYTRYDANL